MRPLYAKLKPGPGHTAEEVRLSQRVRIHRAMYELVARHGYSGVTVRALTRTSEVSTRTFYAQFPNVEECFASTYRAIMRVATERVEEASSASGTRDNGIRASIHALAKLVVDNPQAARLALVDCYDGGPAMLREIETATADLERRLAAGPSSLPPAVSPAVVAGVERVLRTALLQGRSDEAFAGELSDWVLASCDLTPETATNAAPIAAGEHLSQSVLKRSDPGFAILEGVRGERGRILVGVAKLGAVDGYWKLTLPKLRREVGVSLPKFNSLFGSIDRCYLEAIEILATTAVYLSLQPAEETIPWRTRVDRVVQRLHRELHRSPLLVQLGLVEILAPGSEGLLSRERLLSQVTRWVQGSTTRPQPTSAIATEAAASACWRTIRGEVTATGIARRAQAPALLAHLLGATAGADKKQNHRKFDRYIPFRGV